MTNLTPVQEYYKGKTIFITGASGFMGKVLLEKLLYSCSDLKEVIIIVRPKRGKTPESRLEDMFKLPIFQRIKEENPNVLKKVVIYQGDVTFDSLGLSGENLQYVVENTNIVFHLAATLKLEGNLKDAIDMNTTGTKRTLNISKQMKNLEAFVHLSTAFCNCDQDVMYEKVYDFPHKPEDLMRLAEWLDVKTLDAITPDLLKPHPNTYTYSKRLSEILVRDHYETMPVIIARPSIVSPSAYEPVPGWVDNLNGPTGLMVGAGKGVIRSMLIDKRHKSEVIPVDYAINGIITIAYKFATEKRPAEVPVYNITCAEHRKVPWGYVIELSKKIGYQYPVEAGLWYPDGCITTISPACYEPLPGWVDNLNGPTGLMIGCGKGVIRSVLVDQKNKSELIPVDYAISGLIVIPYEFNTLAQRPVDIPVYNMTNAEHRKRPMGYIIEMSKKINQQYPLNAGLWYPDPTVTTNRLYHAFNVMMFHWLPAYLLDFLLLILGQKRFMLRVQQKISIGLEVLQFFTMHPWTFKSQHYSALWDNLIQKDKEIFNMNMDPPNTEEEYMMYCALGARKYLLKEKEEDLPKARRNLKIMWAVDKISKTVIVGLFLYYTLKWTGVLAMF